MAMKTLVRDDFDKWLDYNCFLPKRMVYFGSIAMTGTNEEDGVNFVSAGTLIKNLLYLESINSDAITIHWNSPGGEWHHGMAVYDCIRTMKSHVTMVCYGYIRSMGTIILQACDERILTANCGFMIHDGEEGYEGIPTSFESWANECKHSRHLMYRIYLNKIQEKNPKKYTIKDIETWCNHDTIFRAEQAVALGFADKVIGTKY